LKIIATCKLNIKHGQTYPGIENVGGYISPGICGLNGGGIPLKGGVARSGSTEGNC